MRITLVRQRPSIGDCLLLGPLVRELKRKYPGSELTCVTDGNYGYGCLTEALQGLPGVDRVEAVSPYIWTTESNKAIDLRFVNANGRTPICVRDADLVLDANAAFMQFERDHNGTPPYGIAEFWLRHFNLYKPGMDMRPLFQIPEWAHEKAEAWMPEGKCVGIVLRSGSIHRDWDFDGRAGQVASGLYTAGYKPISIDAGLALGSPYAKDCNGQRLSFVAAVISRCKALLTPDTGMVHLAEAVGTPSVSLWGIMPPGLRVQGYRTLPIPTQSRGVCGPERPNCECQWRFQRWSCMRRIRLTEIIEGMKTVCEATWD